MKLLFILLGTIIGIVLFLLIIFIIVYRKIKAFGKSMGFSDINQLKTLIKEGENNEKYDHKMVSGMTNLLVPKIVEDFPNFSLSELFNKVEISLLAIFATLEKRQIENIKELDLIRTNLKEQIKDMKENHLELFFNEPKFHKHAIKSYEKNRGSISITVSSSLEYYYDKKKDGKSIVPVKNYKKQTSYTTTFVYIYDMDKYDPNQSLIGIHCPNCGAPVKSLKDKLCRYCSSGLDDINLKYFYISAYKEDY